MENKKSSMDVLIFCHTVKLHFELRNFSFRYTRQFYMTPFSIRFVLHVVLE